MRLIAEFAAIREERRPTGSSWLGKARGQFTPRALQRLPGKNRGSWVRYGFGFGVGGGAGLPKLTWGTFSAAGLAMKYALLRWKPDQPATMLFGK